VRMRRVTGGLDASSGSGSVVRDDEDADDDHDRDNGMHVSKAGGDIHIGAKRGVVEATTGGGDVRIGPVAGSVFASTGGGDVEVTIVDAGGAKQDVNIGSGNGDIIVNLPANLDARFEIQTAFTENVEPARIESDWPLERSTTPTFDDREGTPRRYVRGRGVAGSGRGLIRVKTVNGNVVLRRTAK
jgi:hypothetical protein